MSEQPTRGERNNNPGNVEWDGKTKWKGMDLAQPSDGRFIRFADPVSGIRCLARVLLSYSHAYSSIGSPIDTVSEIIERWAPPKKAGVVENDTRAYIAAVAAELRVQPDTRINVTVPDVMELLVRAIIHHENGRVKYSDAQIIDGVARALA